MIATSKPINPIRIRSLTSSSILVVVISFASSLSGMSVDTSGMVVVLPDGELVVVDWIVVVVVGLSVVVVVVNGMLVVVVTITVVVVVCGTVVVVVGGTVVVVVDGTSKQCDIVSKFPLSIQCIPPSQGT